MPKKKPDTKFSDQPNYASGPAKVLKRGNSYVHVRPDGTTTEAFEVASEGADVVRVLFYFDEDHYYQVVAPLEVLEAGYEVLP